MISSRNQFQDFNQPFSGMLRYFLKKGRVPQLGNGGQDRRSQFYHELLENMWNCLRPVSLPLEIEVIARIDDVLSIAQNEIEVKDLLQPECGDFCLR